MRLFIVSNRLPVTFSEDKGKYNLSKSSGGLVSGISSYLSSMNSSSLDKSGYNWVGWPGLSFPEKKHDGIRQVLEMDNLIPVFLNEKIMDRFYFGFCNKTIWPLFHYFPAYTVYDNDMWENYKFVNEKFCDIVCSMVNHSDTIWIHDYHLMLLPSLIRNRINNARIGFFLHIPFPHFEIFRLLPSEWRKEILNGLLGADLIGFHTNDYSRYFLGCVLRILGHDNHMGEIQLEDRIVKVETFQMGINFSSFESNARSEKTKTEYNLLKKNFHEQKIILSIDRLDYTKGILNRLLGYQMFLEKNPEWRGKVTLLAVTVPSRIGVEKYSQMKKEIDEIVGKINGVYGKLNWTPIIYQYRSFHEEQLSALYKISDVALITPLRDGMNLIAKEYMASRTDNTGVLVLSEMAGASKEMIETLRVNPNHVENIADTIKTALEMKKDEQVLRNTAVRSRLKTNDVIKWANNFLLSVYHIKGKQLTFEKKYLDNDIKMKLASDYRKAKKKIIFLDYDGTLVPFKDDPEKAEPDKELIVLLKDLAKDSNIHLVIISGRDYKSLDRWFWNLNCSIVAEHGVWIKKRYRKWRITRKLDDKWKYQLIPYLQEYSGMLAGSFYEEKSHSLVWHYRKSDKIHGDMVANELMDNLKNLTARMNLQVLKGHKIVEIRNIDIDKGTAVKEFHPETNFNFILAIGDDWTDEDMFKALPGTAYTIKVGMAKSYSRYNLYNLNEARNLLKDLIYAKQNI
jgi:trehalose 6-phosphate synthase/phosphatase